MTPFYGLHDDVICKIQGVLRAHPEVEKAVLYGSRAKGSYKNGSDIDLTLHGSSELNLDVLYKIMDEVDDLLLPYTLDLSLFKHIKDAGLIDHIQRVGVPFYERRQECP